MKVLIMVVLVDTILIVLAFWLIPSIIEKRKNPIHIRPPYRIPEHVQKLHQRLLIVDLHADSLLWHRNLLKRGNSGHLDLPRLREAHVALQVFGVVTCAPKLKDLWQMTPDSDQMGLLAFIQGWPPRTWRSFLQRALYQAEKLANFANKSAGQLLFIRTTRDLDRLLTERQQGRPVLGAFPALEGVHALEGDLANLDWLYAAGFRMIGLHHFFDNDAGGSIHGVEKSGLTPFGRELVHRIQAKGMVLDLAHSSPAVIDDVLAIVSAPVIVSHTGVRGTCDNPRNLSDVHIRGIAATGGVIGIAMFELAVCGTTVADTAHAMRYVADLAGVDAVALGTDFDGAIDTPVDVTGLPLLTEALIKQDFTEDEIAQIMGKNILRVLARVLPRK